jgi:hypothetical protein
MKYRMRFLLRIVLERILPTTRPFEDFFLAGPSA